MSPQRDDVPALIHALAHNFRLFARLFSANNSCFLVHSSLCGGSMHHLSIAFSHLATLSEYAQRHTRSCTQRHTSVAQTPSQNDKNLVLSFVIYYCRCSHHFMTPLSLSILPLHVFIYSDFYHFLSLSWPWPLF